MLKASALRLTGSIPMRMPDPTTVREKQDSGILKIWVDYLERSKSHEGFITAIGIPDSPMSVTHVWADEAQQDSTTYIASRSRAATTAVVSLSKQRKQNLLDSLSVLRESASEPNWDGEGAAPVMAEALDIAKMLIDKLPVGIGSPEISADPHGRVDFDWHLENGTMFTISIGEDGEAAISGLYPDQSRLTGMAWDKENDIPNLVDAGIDWLMIMDRR